MSLDQLEPLVWTDVGRYAGPVAVGGLLIMLAAALLRVTAPDMSSGRKRGAEAAFTVGICALIAGVFASQFVRVLPTSDAVRNNVAAVTAWAETEYGVGITDHTARSVVMELDDQVDQTSIFTVQADNGNRYVRIEVNDGKLRLVETVELPKIPVNP